MLELIAAGETSWKKLNDYIERLPQDEEQLYILDESSVTFAPAIPNPSKIICIGLNYKKHADETGLPYPEYPVLFNKFTNALAAHQAEVAVPQTTERLDYEVE